MKKLLLLVLASSTLIIASWRRIIRQPSVPVVHVVKLKEMTTPQLKALTKEQMFHRAFQIRNAELKKGAARTQEEILEQELKERDDILVARSKQEADAAKVKAQQDAARAAQAQQQQAAIAAQQAAAAAAAAKLTPAQIRANGNCADLSIGCVKHVTFTINNQTDFDITPVIALKPPANKTIDIATLAEIGVLPQVRVAAGKDSYPLTIVPKKSISMITSAPGQKVPATISPILYPSSRLTLDPIIGFTVLADQPLQDNVTYTVTGDAKNNIILSPPGR